MQSVVLIFLIHLIISLVGSSAPSSEIKGAKIPISAPTRPFEYPTQMPSGPMVKIELLKDNPELALKYLLLVQQYLEHYSKLIGPYRFESFSVVENTEDVGQAYPGYTLIGTHLINQPFIFRSSLPHEILHSWWGNGVLVDYNRGNWSEGLTTYMADLAMQEEEGKGAEYRRKALQNFQDYASGVEDFPIRKFTERMDRGSQAVGYQKTMMFFQMLENYVGTESFNSSLSRFYRTYFGHEVSFEELQKSFYNEKKPTQNLKVFFKNWIDQPGSPTIGLKNTNLKTAQGSVFKLSFSLTQTDLSQPAVIPFVSTITFADGSSQEIRPVLTSEEESFSYTFDKKVKTLALDPQFKVFRKLNDQEMPATISKVFGERKLVTVSVSSKEAKDFGPWISEIKKFYSGSPVQISVVDESSKLPTDGALWILGTTNKHADSFKSKLSQRKVGVLLDSKMTCGEKTWIADKSVAFLAETDKSSAGRLNMIWVWTWPKASSSNEGPMILQKLSHYTSYSMVTFTNGTNDFYTHWPLDPSPLTVNFPAN